MRASYSPASSCSGRVRVGWVSAIAAVVAAGFAATVWVVRPVLYRRGHLPALPNLTAVPAPLARKLEAAQGDAQSWRGGEQGVAALGRLYHANGYTKEAEACWAILRQSEPRNARWVYYLADLRSAVSDTTGMEALLRETTALAPDYAPAWLKLAAVEFKTGELEAAKRDYRRRLVLLSQDPYAELGLARIELQHGDAAAARARLDRIVQHDPGFSAAHNLYAEILAGAGDAEGASLHRFLGGLAGRFRDADDPWLEELQADCYDVNKLTVLASVEDLTNHGDHGVALLERALEVEPNDARIYAQLGNAYVHRDDAKRALAEFDRGSTRPNANSDFFASYSQACLAAGDAERAREVADRGLARWPDAADLHTARGNALSALGQTDAAIASYRRAVTLAPNVCQVHFNLGNALRQQGATEEGMAELRRALQLEPTFAKALIVLGEAELEAGRLSEAEKYVRPLYRHYPGLVSSRRLMTRWCLMAGVAAARAGSFAEAERDLRDGIAISPDMPELQGRLGLVYAQQGRFDAAATALETYHRLKPEEPMSSLLLGQVYARLGRSSDAIRLAGEAARLARDANDQATLAQANATVRALTASADK